MADPESSTELVSTKCCSQCKQVLPLEKFHKCHITKDGHMWHCKSCASIIQKKLRDAYKNGVKPRPLITEKCCGACKQTLSLDMFWKACHTRDGYNPRCKICDLKRHREWEKNNPDKVAEIHRRRRARRTNASVVDFTARQWEFMIFVQRGKCYYCGKKVTILTRDHVVSLFQGGNHSMDNIVPACLHCNDTKGTREPPIPVQLFLKLGM